MTTLALALGAGLVATAFYALTYLVYRLGTDWYDRL